ncbi:MAG: hypothetical protein ACNI26_14590 [Terasakiella sp.]|uniref:hypothetical protein n=1 Tax=unclassified Terasakiella TaxID=2614952 RepID=UPI003B00DDD1
MTIRTHTETITFRHPFKLDKTIDTQPAGSYQIDTDEELIEGLSFVAYKRIQTIIHLHSKSKNSSLMRALSIKASLLQKALERDRAADGNILKDLKIDYYFLGERS